MISLLGLRIVPSIITIATLLLDIILNVVLILFNSLILTLVKALPDMPNLVDTITNPVYFKNYPAIGANICNCNHTYIKLAAPKVSYSPPFKEFERTRLYKSSYRTEWNLKES